MNVSTWNSMANDAESDFEFSYSIADAVDYAEFQEDLNSWEQENNED